MITNSRQVRPIPITIGEDSVPLILSSENQVIVLNDSPYSSSSCSSIYEYDPESEECLSPVLRDAAAQPSRIGTAHACTEAREGGGFTWSLFALMLSVMGIRGDGFVYIRGSHWFIRIWQRVQKIDRFLQHYLASALRALLAALAGLLAALLASVYSVARRAAREHVAGARALLACSLDALLGLYALGYLTLFAHERWNDV